MGGACPGSIAITDLNADGCLDLVTEAGVLINLGPSDPTGIDLAAPQTGGRMRFYPNPANPGTTVEFALVEPQPVELAVFDMLGRLVKVPPTEHHGQGRHRGTWDGTDAAGQPVASGLYVARLQRRAVSNR